MRHSPILCIKPDFTTSKMSQWKPYRSVRWRRRFHHQDSPDETSHKGDTRSNTHCIPDRDSLLAAHRWGVPQTQWRHPGSRLCRIWFGVEWEHFSISILVRNACGVGETFNLSKHINLPENPSPKLQKPTSLLTKSQKLQVHVCSKKTFRNISCQLFSSWFGWYLEKTNGPFFLSYISFWRLLGCHFYFSKTSAFSFCELDEPSPLKSHFLS